MVARRSGDPRAIVIAAPASGAGKTTVATGLMAALRRRGTAVAPFKVGPDYIDPGYHALATGRPGRNLDPVLVGEQRIAPLFGHGARGTELAVVEGVMGLFDGRVADGAGSTAHVASLLGAPVVLVVDASGQGRSLAALLHGFRGYDSQVRLAGVVLNRVGSARHVEVLQAACAEVGLPVLGALPRHAELALPSRHLGLVPAAEHGAAAHAAVDAMAELAATHIDLDAVLGIAEGPAGAPVEGPAWDPVAEIAAARAGLPAPPHRPGHVTPHRPGHVTPHRPGQVPPHRPVVAVAGGSAFTFGYAEHVELLTAAGAEVAVVDPLRDEALPPGTSALVIPGGFPEEHAAELSANERLRAEVAAFAAAGGPVQAECGGLLYLCRELDGRPMCGVLPATARLSGRLTLGYRDAVALGDSVAFAAGQRVSGHEFHHCSVIPRAGEQAAWRWTGGERAEGFVTSGVHASFLHSHPAGNPASVARFVAGSTSVQPSAG